MQSPALSPTVGTFMGWLPVVPSPFWDRDRIVTNTKFDKYVSELQVESSAKLWWDAFEFELNLN